MDLPKLQVRLYGDPCLREISKPVQEVGPAERMLIVSMIETMHESKGIGLAAPQIGINRRILVVDVGDGPIAVINPEIIKQIGSSELEEGCLSIPEVNINVTRAERIVFKYIDENNDTIEASCEDLLARVILHETDHLDGKLIVDYATDEEIVKYKDILEKLEKENKNGSSS